MQLVAGGSGVVPLLAMARAHTDAGDATPFRLLYSVRTPADVFFRAELEQARSDGFRLDLVYTREAPDDWPREPGRLTHSAFEQLVVSAAEEPDVFVGGPTAFVEAVAQWLVELGHRPGRDPYRTIRRHVMTHVDGNAVAGAFADLLAFDVTAARARCAGCGAVAALATAMVYRSAAGSVVRCAGCDATLVTVVEAEGRTWLGFSGITAIEVRRPTGDDVVG